MFETGGVAGTLRSKSPFQKAFDHGGFRFAERRPPPGPGLGIQKKTFARSAASLRVANLSAIRNNPFFVYPDLCGLIQAKQRK